MSETNPTNRARVSRIQINGLFGALEHDVKLNEDARVTIVLGANGVGKTQLFECVAALFGNRLQRLVEVPFKNLRISFTDGTSVFVEQRTVELPANEAPNIKHIPLRLRKQIRHTNIRRSLTIQKFGANGKPTTGPWETKLTQQKFNFEEIELPHWLEQLDSERWIDTRTERLLTAAELRKYYNIPVVAIEGTPDWLKNVADSTYVQLIETQRLIRTSRRRGKSASAREIEGSAVQFAVVDLVEELNDRRSSFVTQYSRQQARLDQTYVDRFLTYEVPHNETPESLQQQLQDIERRRIRLEQLHLLATEVSAESPTRRTFVSQEKRSALSLYAQDMAKKLAILEPLAAQLESLISRVNRKLSDSGKRLVTDAEQGLAIEGLEDSRRLQLDLLSSGEQHQLVLLYDLLFRVEPNRSC